MKEKTQRKSSRRLLLEKESQRHQNVSKASGQSPLGYEDAAAGPKKARHNTQKVHATCTTHNSTPLFFSLFVFFSLSHSLMLSSSFFFFGGQATGVPEWVCISSQAPDGHEKPPISPSPLPRELGFASRSTTPKKSPQCIEWPTFCLFQMVGLPSRPGPCRIAVVSCQALCGRGKNASIGEFFLLLLMPRHCEQRRCRCDNPCMEHGPWTVCDVMAPSQITPSNAMTCYYYYLLLCTQRV